ncbi:MAG: hypothetical protein R3A47_04300 [Polyangiales bacterium]
MARISSLIVVLTAVLCSSLWGSAASAQPCQAGKACYYVPPNIPGPVGYDTGNIWDTVIASQNGNVVTGTYRFGFTGAPTAFTVSAGSPVTISRAKTVGVASNFNVIEQRGMFIEADGDLSVASRRASGPWQSSASIKQSAAALGTRFRVGGYSMQGQESSIVNSVLDAISVYAPTGAVVTFTAPPGAPSTYWADGISTPSKTVTLAPGETYMIRTVQGCNTDVDGALVTSTAPIVVNSGGRGTGRTVCGIGGTCGDEGYDNVLPVDKWGKTFAIDNYPSDDTQGERVSIVADFASTEVRVNGTLATTLNSGGVYQFIPADGSLVETSKPVGVFHNAAGNACEHGMSFVAPMFFPGVGTLYATFNVVGSGILKITIETARVSTLQLDGSALASYTTETLPTRPDITIVTKTGVGSGFHTLSATGDFQLGVLTYTSGAGLFGFYTPFRIPACGTGELDELEGCDDGNVVNGDGCSALCRIEIGTAGCTVDEQCVPGARCDVGGVCRGCLEDADCDDLNSCTADTCVSQECSFSARALGDSCAGGVCNGDAMAPACVVCVDNGAGTDAGCTAGAPDCVNSGGLKCTGCGTNADCEDGNECTTNTCGSGTCGTAATAAGTSCNGGDGVCNGNASAPACVVCIDDVAGSGMDSGCTVAEPFCDRSGATPVCAECLDSGSCGSGEICVAGACTGTTISISAPPDVVLSNTITPSGTTINAPNGSTVNVTISNANDTYSCAAYIVNNAWSCSNVSITTGAGYTVVAVLSVSGSEVSATKSFYAGDIGACDTLSAGDPCTSSSNAGVCVMGDSLYCCTGCVDGALCRAGLDVTHCGEGGIVCSSCDDSNSCTTDACDPLAEEICVNTELNVGDACGENNGTCTGTPGSLVCFECEADSDCDDSNECTSNVCNNDGTCTYPSATINTVCNAGAGVCNGDMDAPACVQCTINSQCDDEIVCTDDVCTGNTCSNPATAAYTPCDDAGGVCNGDGDAPECVECLVDGDCTGGNECTDNVCDNNVCTYPALALNTTCDGGDGVCNGDNGAPACVECTADDQCDDGNECTDKVCDTNVCTFPSLAIGTECSGGMCNGAAQDPLCVGCTADDQCDDGNDCTNNVCDNGACQYPSLTAGDTCATGVCDGADTVPECVECVADDDCASGETCDTTSSTCVVACSGDADCSGGVCNTDTSECVTDCVANDDCGPTGTCDDTANTCVETCVGNDDCNQGTCNTSSNECVTTCTSNDECGDGICSSSTGECTIPCTTNDECGDGSCDTTTGECTNSCTSDDQCGNGVCNTTTDQCVSSCDSNSACGPTGTCSNSLCVPNTASGGIGLAGGGFGCSVSVPNDDRNGWAWFVLLGVSLVSLRRRKR